MFDFFIKKQPIQDPICYCTKLAENARIDAAMKDGNYHAFLVFIDIETIIFTKYFNHPDARSAFLEIIETRISDWDYDEPSGDIDMVKQMRKMTGWKRNLNVVRTVVGLDNKPILNWNPPPETTQSYPLNYCLRVASKAIVEAMVQNGRYVCFAILLEVDTPSFLEKFKNTEARSAFIEEIESRISEGKYKDPNSGILTEEAPKNLNILRAIVGLDNRAKAIFKWSPQNMEGEWVEENARQ